MKRGVERGACSGRELLDTTTTTKRLSRGNDLNREPKGNTEHMSHPWGTEDLILERRVLQEMPQQSYQNGGWLGAKSYTKMALTQKRSSRQANH